MQGPTNRRQHFRALAVAATTLALSLGAGLGHAQQGGQQGPGGGAAAQANAFVSDTTGFTRIYTPGSLAGWDGDPRFWSAKGDTIVAESTPEREVDVNTFLIYRGDENLRDFEFKAEYRFPALQGNSGVQIRSAVRPDAPHRWRVTGIQVDLDASLQFAGMIYGEEAGGFLARRGLVTQTRPGANASQQVGTLGDPNELRGMVNPGGWNQLHIIARGPTIITLVNGRVTSILVDDAPNAVSNPAQARLQSGLLALQMHTGAPFRIQFRNVFLKKM